MAELGFQAFDADNHYYEAPDAFTRHLDPTMAKRGDAVGRRRRQGGGCWSAGGVNRFIPNPHLRPGRPARLPRRLLPGPTRPADDIRGAFGELEADPARVPRAATPVWR